MPVGVIIGATVASAGASVIGAGKQSRATERGLQAQTQAAASADATRERIYNDQVEREEPFRQLGLSAINPMADLLGLDFQHNTQPSTGQKNAFNSLPQNIPAQSQGNAFGFIGGLPGYEFTPYDGQGGGYFQPQERVSGADSPDYAAQPQAALSQEERTQNAFNTLTSRPGYQFQLDQGVQAIDAGAAQRGMLGSGAQQKALLKYGQDYGSNAYDKELNRLSLVMGGGQMATQSMNANAGAYGAGVAQNALALGDARASAYQRQGNISANAFNNVAGAVGWGVRQTGDKKGWYE